MSDRVDKGKQPMHPYQSLWMSHWLTLQEKNRSSVLLGDCEYDHGTKEWDLQKAKEITSNICRSTEQRMDVKAINFGILNGNQAMSLRNERDDKSGTRDSSVAHLSQKSQSTPDIEHVPSLLSLAPPGSETSYMDSRIQKGSVSQCPREMVKSQMVSSSDSAVSTQIFDIGDRRYESGSIPTVPSFLCSRKENVNHVRSILSSKRKLSDSKIMEVSEQEHCCNHCSSGVSAGKNIHIRLLHFRKYIITVGYRKNDSSLLVDCLLVKNNRSPAFLEDQYKRMHNCSGISMFPTYPHDEITKRTYTFAEEFDRCNPRYHETRTFIVTENTNSNLQKENQDFRDSRVYVQVQENAPITFYSFPQLTGARKQGVQLQLLSSSDGDGNDNAQDVSVAQVVSKNESSADTDTMDTDKIKEKHLSGAESSSIKKDVKANADLRHHDYAILEAGKNVQPHKRRILEIPDMNIELPAEPDEASLAANAEPSTSITRSLDIDCEANSSSNWIKRLKISDSSNQSIGTKSFSMDEATSYERGSQFVSKGMTGERASSKPAPISAGKELSIFKEKTTSLRPGKSSYDSTKQLCSWINRWQKHPVASPKKQSEPVVVCDPQSSKVSLEELQKKPFASIAAMALLGKGWRGLKCQYRNRGALTVWDS